MTSSNYSDRIPETTGHIASDSLAAESLRGDKTFAANEPERGVAPSSQPARGNTASNTDTSGADVLDSAPYKEARLTDTQVQGKDYQTPAEIPGLDKFADSTYDPRSGGSSTGSYSGSTGGVTTGGTAQAPAGGAGGSAEYSAQHTSGVSAEHLKPKGRNVQEVSSFDNEERAPNASFQFGDIDSNDDPARAGIHAVKNANAREPAADAGRAYAGKESYPPGAQRGYGNLDSDEQA